jgi:carbamoyltransferase
LIEDVVDRLLEGQVIAWVAGRMEFGPRALGARSILADPRRPEMQSRINALVKQREAFRPFAPAVLESVAHEHFALDHPSPFMLETCPVISPIPLPAVTHVDGSARVQTVSRATNGRFADLIAHFYNRTGCPVLLNTSFNLRGEPIVCSIMDAISTFGRSDMEALVLEDLLVDKNDIPAPWRTYSRTPAQKPEDYVVYTML